MQITRAKLKSGAVVKHQRMSVVLKTTSNTFHFFKSSAAPLYRSSELPAWNSLSRKLSHVKTADLSSLMH